MILLTSTSDLVQLVTDSAAAVKVHVSYLDNNAGTITPGRTNTAIGSATTTTIVGSPGASVQRSVRYLGIRNSDSTLQVNARVTHTDGSTVVDLINGTLQPGEALIFTDENGWQTVTSIGAVKQTFNPPVVPGGTTGVPALRFNTGTLETSPQAGDLEYDGSVFYVTPITAERGVNVGESYVCLSAAYTLTSQTAAQKMFNTPTNGQITVGSGRTYEFQSWFSLTSLSGTSGSYGWALGGTATFTSIGWASMAAKLATITTPLAGVMCYNTTTSNTAISSAGTGTTGFAVINGIARVNAGGTIIPSVSLGVANAAVVGVNSYFRIWPLGSGSVTSVGNWS